ncbi:MAG: hypothetical protein IT447_15385 [Phycisphaerales bacterium]|jgi:hypothetical protein|nr:hypothetical protein [Phycisphaerales bacterium]
MRRYRHLLAAVIVTTAMCVDRVGAPASAMPPQFVQLARQLAGRLGTGLRKAAPMAPIACAPRHHIASPAQMVIASPAETIVHRVEYTPFRFRLPPPALIIA